MILFIKHADTEGPGTLEEAFKDTSHKTQIVNLNRHQSLPDLKQCAAIISLGGPMNVYQSDKYPFLKAEENFLKKAIAQNIPVLGVCLGAQLLAKVCGAEVNRAQGQEIGWYDLTLTKEARRDPLFSGLNNTLSVFQWHQDSFDLPQDSSLLASSLLCQNQAVRMGRYAWGLQFHPEMTLNMVSQWLNTNKEDLDKTAIIAESFQKWDEYFKQTQKMYKNFKRIVESASKHRVKSR